MANGDRRECRNDSRGTTGALAVARPGSCRRADGRPVRCRGHYGAAGCSISKRALAVSRNWRHLQGSWEPSASAGVVSASRRGRARGARNSRSTGRHWTDGPGGSVTTPKHSGGACALRDGCAAERPRETPAAPWARTLPDPARRGRNLFALKSRDRGQRRARGSEDRGIR